MPLNNPHVIKEEDLENSPSGNTSVSGGQVRDEEDVYNSDPAVKKKFSSKDFFGFFKLPLIIIVFLIAAGLVFLTLTPSANLIVNNPI